MSPRSVAQVIGLASVAMLASACRGQTSRESPIGGIRNMHNQERYDIQAESEFFADKRTMRTPPEGAVSQQRESDVEVLTGRTKDNAGYVLSVPRAVTNRAGGMEALLTRGQERYGIYCAPCHDNTGNGKGAVFARAAAGGASAFVPPSFHDDRLRHIPDGQLYATIENGKGNMPPYGHLVSVDDRWAIASYVRALQVANARLNGEKADNPPSGPVPRVEVTKDHLAIAEKINFDTGKSTVSQDSQALLDDIATTIKSKLASIRSIEVQGHTSSDGDPKVNLALSKDRAGAVVTELVKRGVPAGLISARGYGATMPVDTSGSADANERNRRVEFVVVQNPAQAVVEKKP